MAMVASNPVLNYEDVRKQRIKENNRKMEALGLLGLSQSLKKTPVKRPADTRRMPVEGEFVMEARRSSRLGGKPAVSYTHQLDLMPGMRMRVGSRDRQPLARRYLSDAARMAAVDAAEEVYKGLVRPAFVKPMLHSHTASGFWLGLPSNFCKKFLPPRDEKIILEDEMSLEWECVYLVHKVGLSGGWRGFSLDHELVDGDCLIFELTDSRRFKVRIFRFDVDYEVGEEAVLNEGKADASNKDAATEKKKPMKYNKKAPVSTPPKLDKGRNLIAFPRKLGIDDGEVNEKERNDGSPKLSRKVKKEADYDVAGPSRSLKRSRGHEYDDDGKAVVAPQSVKREVKFKKQENDGEGDVDLGSDEVNESADDAFRKPSARSEDTQTDIRSFGRITRNSLAE